ncbi:hypothetical protein EVG20_g9204 [Dentipellis fragilis]|uniref:Uncharacterized protein n=1 Tax=Dentipellis fragilis TaxID=205917 RepID=A0A4Y9Y1Y7_9AGAM|nr:hypothetical protein EVG20_g9204 [Dentipellis fragilis]
MRTTCLDLICFMPTGEANDVCGGVSSASSPFWGHNGRRNVYVETLSMLNAFLTILLNLERTSARHVPSACPDQHPRQINHSTPYTIARAWKANTPCDAQESRWICKDDKYYIYKARTQHVTQQQSMPPHAAFWKLDSIIITTESMPKSSESSTTSVGIPGIGTYGLDFLHLRVEDMFQNFHACYKPYAEPVKYRLWSTSGLEEDYKRREIIQMQAATGWASFYQLICNFRGVLPHNPMQGNLIMRTNAASAARWLDKSNLQILDRRPEDPNINYVALDLFVEKLNSHIDVCTFCRDKMSESIEEANHSPVGSYHEADDTLTSTYIHSAGSSSPSQGTTLCEASRRNSGSGEALSHAINHMDSDQSRRNMTSPLALHGSATHPISEDRSNSAIDEVASESSPRMKDGSPLSSYLLLNSPEHDSTSHVIVT